MVLIHIDRLMAECLNRVCVEDDPFSWAISPISLIGWIVPISLLANITEIRIVSGRIAFFNSSMETEPYSSTGR